MKLSETSLQKLQLFCNSADKIAGTGHPLDEERWFAFICQTVDEDKVIDADTFEDILQDEKYLGKGNTLSEHLAEKLATRYERDCRFLQYCRRK